MRPVRFVPVVSVLMLPALALVLGCGTKAPPKQGRQSVAVTTAPVRRASVPFDLEANGTVMPLQNATVVPQVDGVLKEVDFAEGQMVTAGQTLFRIDARPYQAAFDQATAALARDKATAAYTNTSAARFDTLAAERSVTREQQEQARASASAAAATVSADQAALDLAKFNLDNTVIRAPISGRTGSLLVRAGNVVHASGGSALVVINQVRPILVRFNVPGTSLPLLQKYGSKGGLAVTATPSDDTPTGGGSDSSRRLDAPGAAPGATTPHHAAPGVSSSNPDTRGTLSFIDNAVDTTTGTLQLKATFANPGGSLWAGQFVATSLRLFVEDSAIVVPTGAVVTGQAGTYVWIVDSTSSAEQRPVVVERAAGDITIVSSGVVPGEQVVIQGQSRLTDGAKVTLGGGNDSTKKGGRGGRGGRSGGGRGAGGATSP